MCRKPVGLGAKRVRTVAVIMVGNLKNGKAPPSATDVGAETGWLDAGFYKAGASGVNAQFRAISEQDRKV